MELELPEAAERRDNRRRSPYNSLYPIHRTFYPGLANIVLSRLLLVLIVVPFVELCLLLLLGDLTAWYVPILFVIGTGILGTWLARFQGLVVYRRIQNELAAGRMPTDSMIDGVMIFVAGLLLVMPGVLTDIVGISAMIPPVRAFYRRQLVDWFHRTFKVTTVVAGESVQASDVVDSYVVEKGNKLEDLT